MRKMILAIGILVLVSSCKKADTNVYEPMAKKLLGTWKLASVYDKATETTQTYPGTYRATTITFNDSALVKLILPCNVGAASFIADENGGFQLRNSVKPAFVCSIDEFALESEVYDALKNAYWIEINGNQLKMVTPTGYVDMTYNKN
jgi:hypothetical protein